MSLDAIVWLVAGAGLGVGATLVLLIGYAGLERWRLNRRFRRARLLRQVAEPAATPVPAPARASAARVVRTARPERPTAVAPDPAGGNDGDVAAPKVAAKAEPPVPAPAIEPVVAVPEPVVEKTRPMLTVVRSEPEIVRPSIEPQPEKPETVAAKIAEPAKAAANPRVVPPDEPAPEKRGPQSVEEMFAEAFALDKVSVAPLPGATDEAKT